MARVKKRGTTGQAKNFITRTQAIRKLQISLPDFRRLCIFKGIYPREPRNKKKASRSSTPSTTFYYTKDIQYLLHEPLLQKFREHKALSKKIARALGKDEVGDAVRLENSGLGKITLDHVVKERYPTFIDALRDLDDALSMVFLFANLPSNSTVPPKTVALCQRLSHEFQHYLIVTHSLRKSFLSIKGIYYQATIQGQDIMWLVPHRFVQRVTEDVDFRIMGTFVEFYTTFLGFVNFRLYNSIGLVYPPKFDAKSDEQSGELGAFKLEGRGIGVDPSGGPTSTKPQVKDSSEPVQSSKEIQNKVDAITAQVNELPDNGSADVEETAETVLDQIDDFEPTGEGADVLPQPQISHFDAAALFAPFTFFLSRETPRQPLEFLLRSFGCKRIGWDAVLGDGAFTNNEADPAITHQVVDRPPVTMAHYDVGTEEDVDALGIRPGYRVPGRIYVQPQWVWDCINNAKLLRPDLYAPGATLPPHLSPWVKPTKGAYDPSASLEEQEREGEAEEFEEEEAEAAAIEAAEAAQAKFPLASGQDGGNGIDYGKEHQKGEESEEVEEDEDEVFATFEDDEGDGIEIAHESSAVGEDLHQAELEAEAAGHLFSASHPDGNGTSGNLPHHGTLKAPEPSNEARKKAARRRQEEQDELQRRLGMMSRKKRLAMEKAIASQGKEEQEAEVLRKKRRRLEKASGMTSRV